MRTLLLASVVAPFLLSACTGTPKVVVEQSTDLGFGFRRVVMAEPVKVSFESIGHFAYLYYRDRRLCQVDECSVSPSGRYVIYQDGPSGDLFLFRRADSRLTKLTSHFIAPADSFQWHEDSNSVEAHFTGGHAAETFALE
jgi:hypothetical protein